jgi:hypothetical protein
VLVLGWHDRQLDDHRALALIALSRLLDDIFSGWDREDGPSAAMKLKLRIGDDIIYAQLVPAGIDVPFPWSQEDRLQAGAWLFEHAMALDLFDYDEDGYPIVSDKWQPEVKQVRADLIRAHPKHMPLFEPPPDWTGWFTEYPNRYGHSLCATGGLKPKRRLKMPSRIQNGSTRVP